MYPNNYQTTIPYYTYYNNNQTRQFGPPRPPRPRPPMNNRPLGGGFLLPFTLGFLASPLLPRPNYYPNYYYRPPYYPYY